MLLSLRSGLGTEASQRLEASFAQGLCLSCAFLLCLEQHLGQRRSSGHTCRTGKRQIYVPLCPGSFEALPVLPLQRCCNCLHACLHVNCEPLEGSG